MSKPSKNEVAIRFYQTLLVYPYRRPGQVVGSWAVATSDRPEDVVHRCNSRAAAERWANRRCTSVTVEL